MWTVTNLDRITRLEQQQAHRVRPIGHECVAPPRQALVRAQVEVAEREAMAVVDVAARALALAADVEDRRDALLVVRVRATILRLAPQQAERARDGK